MTKRHFQDFMELAHIKGLLEKYTKLLFRDEETKKLIRTLIIDISGVDVSESAMHIKNNELYITGDSITKNELFLYKNKIIDILHKNNITNIVDIH